MRQLVSWGVFVLVLLGVYVTAGPTSMGGPASYVIVDGTSMEPTYEDGDLVIAYGKDVYEIGDVIVYDAPIDTQFDVIHRIVDRVDGGFITQGDNRTEVDGWIAPDGSIYGAARLLIPRGGLIVDVMRQPAVIAALAAALVTLELLKRDEERSEQAADTENDDKPQEEPEGVRAVLEYARSAAERQAANEQRPSGTQKVLG